jgi:hypothetical protein
MTNVALIPHLVDCASLSFGYLGKVGFKTAERAFHALRSLRNMQLTYIRPEYGHCNHLTGYALYLMIKEMIRCLENPLQQMSMDRDERL